MAAHLHGLNRRQNQSTLHDFLTKAALVSSVVNRTWGTKASRSGWGVGWHLHAFLQAIQAPWAAGDCRAQPSAQTISDWAWVSMPISPCLVICHLQAGSTRVGKRDMEASMLLHKPHHEAPHDV